MRRVLRWACNGTQSTMLRAMWSTVPCSRPLARPYWTARADPNANDGGLWSRLAPPAEDRHVHGVGWLAGSVSEPPSAMPKRALAARPRRSEDEPLLKSPSPVG